MQIAYKDAIRVIGLAPEKAELYAKAFGADLGRAKVSPTEMSNIKFGKAGRKRWLGYRPTVRGSAMSPRDHPHGGGEGRTPIGMSSPKSPWGGKTLGKKTRRNKATAKYIVRRRGKKRR